MSQTEPLSTSLSATGDEHPLNVVKSGSIGTGVLMRRSYFIGFGAIYLLAFLSLWSQIHGLIGEQGLLPASRYFQAVHQRLGTQAYGLLPSLCWFGSNDLMLSIWCGAGTALAIVLMIGFAPRLILLLLWVIYLSLCIAGQDFLSFQWDTLLLEMTICSLTYAPGGWRPDWRVSPGPLDSSLLWGLAFKLMFLSGVTKLLSGDSSWIDGSALQFHYYTQPIPSWTAWYAFQCPQSLHRLALLVMFIVEVLLPFFVFAGPWGRLVFGLASIALMIAIEATGNFGFFNLQTMVLCLPLLNDDFLKRISPKFLLAKSSTCMSAPIASNWQLIGKRILVTCVLCASLLTIVREIASTARGGNLTPSAVAPIQFAETLLLSWGRPCVLDQIAALRTINGYGLFRVMTVRRNEIIIEISDDGMTWTACEFRYKPGRVDRAPPIVAPHMPRLDWQMWFASLNLRGNQHWLSQLIERILDGNPSTARLLGRPELTLKPPKFARLAFYEYKFTSAEQRRTDGAWWNRTLVGYLTESINKRPTR